MTTLRSVERYLTARDGAQPRIARQLSPVVSAPPAFKPVRTCSITVDLAEEKQVIEGFGGAFTEASATVWAALSAARQQEIVEAYFDPVRGHGYSLGRTHLNSCDFALGNYAYCEQDGDFELATFSIERDRRALIPLIQRAQRQAGGTIKLLASPWSPPAWMKTNGQMNQGGELRPECRDVWARYYVKYLESYVQEGVPIWALTVQNEPAASQRWDSCVYSPEQERDFVRDHLGPTLHAAGFADVKLLVWDHNRDQLFERVKVIYDDPAAARYVWGAGFHWYVTDAFDNVLRTAEAWPDKKLLFTEGCQERGPHLGEWPLGERYARSIIKDLNHGAVGWIDWNLLLDFQGGPNHVGNFCSAPIMADAATDQLLYQSSYYYLGHFSRFIRPGARRLVVASERDELEVLATRNPDGRIAIVIMNRTEEALPATVRLGDTVIAAPAPARSIQTLLVTL